MDNSSQRTSPPTDTTRAEEAAATAAVPPSSQSFHSPPSQVPISIGAILRAAREAQKIPLERAAYKLKMRPQLLLALEQGNFASLPDPSYVRYLIRHCANYLKVELPPLESYSSEQEEGLSGRKGQQTPSLTPHHPLYGEEEDHGSWQSSFSLPQRVLPAVVTACIILGFLVLIVYFHFERKSHREDEKFLGSPAAAQIVEEEADSSVTSPVIDLKKIHTFDSALLENASKMAKMNPPLLRLTKKNDVDEKAKAFQCALRMSFMPALPKLSSETRITPPRSSKKKAPQPLSSSE